MFHAMNDIWTVKRILDWIEGYLAEKGIDNPKLSAQWLVADALNCSRLELYTDLERPLTDTEREILRGYTKRRGEGEPLQYITGKTDFRFVTLEVQADVLIPRPETEVLVSEALSACNVNPDNEEFLVVDLCTGSGNVACSVAHELPNAQVFATDISPAACALAMHNVDSLGLSDRISVLEGDLDAALPADLKGRVELLISNPPYIPSGVLASLNTEVIDYEPALALDGGDDGLDIFRRILTVAQDLLCPGGVVAVELFESSLESAAQLARDAGFQNVRIATDLAGKPRILIAQSSY